MDFLLQMDEVARRNWAAEVSGQIAVFVHPLYEYLLRERISAGPKVTVATTKEGVEMYKQQYARMPRVAMDCYPDQLLEVARAALDVIIFEEYDRVMHLRMVLAELKWERTLVVPTHLGNPVPSEIELEAGKNLWYPQVADAFSQIGHEKDFVVYGGGFMSMPDPACAGIVLLFLLGMETHGNIKSARAGDKAVLRV